MRNAIDINADLGESYGVYQYGHDAQLMPLITSANIACGFHAGDPNVMRASVKLAHSHGVSIGAHIGLPDPMGFGRRRMSISAADAYSYTAYQLGALDAFARELGVVLRHVKPHGALYMMAADDHVVANAIAKAVRDFDSGLSIYTLPGSALADSAEAVNLRSVPEFFADRPYLGSDVVMFDWTLDELGGADGAASRLGTMLDSHAFDQVETVCVHSDTPGAPAMLEAIRGVLESRNLRIAAPTISTAASRNGTPGHAHVI